MPEWLLKNDSYIPSKDKDTFINKSILSFIGILSKIKKQRINKKGLYLLNPTLKLIFTIAIIILISLTRSNAFLMVTGVYFLLMLSSLNGEEILSIFKVTSLVIVFTLVMLIPSMARGNVVNSIQLLIKIFETLISVNVLSTTTKIEEINKSFKVFFIPDIFIMVFDIAVRYIFILGQFSLDMLYTLRLRSVGKSNNKQKSITGIIGTLFLKSRDMSEEMYDAMECRGYSGEYSYKVNLKFSAKDYVYMIINVILVILFFYIRR